MFLREKRIDTNALSLALPHCVLWRELRHKMALLRNNPKRELKKKLKEKKVWLKTNSPEIYRRDNSLGFKQNRDVVHLTVPEFSLFFFFFSYFTSASFFQKALMWLFLKIFLPVDPSFNLKKGTEDVKVRCREVSKKDCSNKTFRGDLISPAVAVSQ